ncbi:unnamed protein product [Mytilus coruscus]|uniref:Ig-like domain-containing protein n=1 Tax=Mytilus coruscus TaxID=42192 RepID=A0A6J8CA65_MYTCO|nr:unnamed protein product [Mytilus coruscus]
MAARAWDFDRTMTLTCTINSRDTIDLEVTRQWSKGAELIAYKGHLDKPSKYSEILSTRNKFSLLIKNLTVSDVTSIYQCQYSFETCTKGLNIDTENFEYPPSDKTTQVLYNYTTEGNPFIQLHFTKVFPLPNCTVKIQNKQFNFQVNSVNNHTIYLEVKLIYTFESEIVCDLEPNVVCHLIGDYPIHIEKFKPCKKKNVNLVVVLVPLFSICLLISLVVCVVICIRRRIHSKKTPEREYQEVNQNSQNNNKMVHGRYLNDRLGCFICIVAIVQDIGAQNIVYFEKGESVVIACNVSPTSWCIWDGPGVNGSEFTTYSDMTTIDQRLPNAHRLTIIGNISVGEYNLHISNVSSEDEGYYRCSCMDMDIHERPMEATVSLKMKVPPSNLTVNGENTGVIHGKEGHQLDLNCSVEMGKPEESILWYNSSLLLGKGGPRTFTWSIVPQRYDHERTFTCIVNSSALRVPLNKSIMLDIKFKPYTTISVKPTKLSRIEGSNGMICCEVQSNPPVLFTWLLKNNGKLEIGNSINNCFVFPSFNRNDSGHYTCLAGNNIGRSNSSNELNILYPARVTVNYSLRPDYIDFTCNVAGEPNNYSFLPWIHESEFHKKIRLFNGTRLGTLPVQRTNNISKQYEDSGYYICRVSNGIPDMNGKKVQKGMTFVTFEGPPTFLLGNTKVQYGAFDNTASLWVQVYSNIELLSCTIRRSDRQNNETSYTEETRVIGYVVFHGVKVMVLGSKLLFDVYINRNDDFTNYTVKVCNKKGCIYMTLELRANNNNTKSMSFVNSSWQILGSLFGGSLFISLFWNIYCFLKRKKNSGIHTIVPLEVQYDEIGDINFTSANIQVLQNNARESISSVNLQGLERTSNICSSLDKSSSSDSSEHSQSISLLNEDGYEHPYQTIDLGNIEMHPYTTVWSNLYQNTTIFPNQIMTNYDKERNPWLIIYKK